MASDIEFRYERAGEKVTIYSIEIKGENFFRDLLYESDPEMQAKIDWKTNTVAEKGIHVSNSHFSKVKGKQHRNNYYLKILNPLSIRISSTLFHCDGTTVILLFGWEKKSNEADKKTQRFYKRAQTIIDKIHGDPDGTKKKLRAAFKRK